MRRKSIIGKNTREVLGCLTNLDGDLNHTSFLPHQFLSKSKQKQPKTVCFSTFALPPLSILLFFFSYLNLLSMLHQRKKSPVLLFTHRKKDKSPLPLSFGSPD